MLTLHYRRLEAHAGSETERPCGCRWFSMPKERTSSRIFLKIELRSAINIRRGRTVVNGKFDFFSGYSRQATTSASLAYIRTVDGKNKPSFRLEG